MYCKEVKIAVTETLSCEKTDMENIFEKVIAFDLKVSEG
jgi:hypothetical protein